MNSGEEPGEASETGGGLLLGRGVDALYSVATRKLALLGLDPYDIEDVAQEVMLVVVRRSPDYDPGVSSVDTWVGGIARKVARTHQRKKSALQARTIGFEQVGEIQDPVDRLEVVFTSTIASLRDLDRQLLTMRFMQNMNSSEIAAALGMNHEAVRSKIGRAVERLRSSLQIREGLYLA